MQMRKTPLVEEKTYTQEEVEDLNAKQEVEEAKDPQARYKGLKSILDNMNALVVGVGALGSHLSLILNKMGAAGVYVVDPDIVQSPNLGVQAFNESDCGNAKVDAIALQQRHTGKGVILPFCMEWEEFAKVSLPHRIKSITHVFMCVDSMKVRAEIFGNLVDLDWCGILVDGRLAANMAWAHSLALEYTEGGRQSHSEALWYEKTMYPDSEAVDVQNCAVQMTAYSAYVTVGLMVSQAMRFSQEKLAPESLGIDMNNALFYKET